MIQIFGIGGVNMAKIEEIVFLKIEIEKQSYPSLV